MKTIVQDRVDERITIEVHSGVVFIHREFKHGTPGEWRIDPSAGIAFGWEYLVEFVDALRPHLPFGEW